RLRIGIGAAVGSGTDYVLGRFEAPEAEVIREAQQRAADAVECWIEHGADATMTRFNSDPSPA
ncbi:MAG: aminoacyl-tRNA hydrolase, partial [Planctomycetes bacterium]|nr:aminoacyl-tRNA hydrolase [Planctomycetota bacterium]